MASLTRRSSASSAYEGAPLASTQTISETHREAATDTNTDILTRPQAWWLYLSHFLSMWNSRTYEYGAAAFPGNLLPSSINGIAETICVLVSAAALGRWVDREPSRLRPLLLTIIINRLTLITCCLLWIFLFFTQRPTLRLVMFAVILGLGMVEKASRMGNTLSMERDWVPTIAEEDAQALDRKYSLTHLNTVMRRIDISCKFLAPLVISGIVALIEPKSAAMAVGAFSAVSMVTELWAAMRVWKYNRRLRAPKRGGKDIDLQMDRLGGQARSGESSHHPPRQIDLPRQFHSLLLRLREILDAHVDGVKYYFSTIVWLPSVGTAILHASVLAWSGTLITWLLNAGFSLPEITVAKGVGSIFEIGSTFVFPLAVDTIRSRKLTNKGTSISYQMVDRRSVDEEESSEGASHASDGFDEAIPNRQRLGDPTLHGAVVRVALWAIGGLAVSLVPTMAALFYLDALMPSAASNPSTAPSPLTTTTFAAVAFLAFLSVSFLGRWTYDLAVTQLTLMLVPATHRSSFGGTEMALVSTISLVHWVAAAIWHEQDDFRWLALGSFCAVTVAAAGFIRWAAWWRTQAERPIVSS